MVALWRDQDGLAPPVADDEAFDLAVQWRCEAIVRLGLTDGLLATAASPSPVPSQLLDFAIRHIGAAPDGPVVDVGAGLAGIAETVRGALQRPVVAFDRSWGACAGARRLFPDVQVARAHPHALPIRAHTVPAAVACGLLSVLDDIAPVFAEVCRVMMPAGRFAVVDLVSASSISVRVGSRVYPPAESIAGSIIESGFDLVDEAIGLTTLSDWALADEQVARDVARRRRGEPAFEHWLDDRRRRERLMSSDRIVMAGFAATPTGRVPARRDGRRRESETGPFDVETDGNTWASAARRSFIPAPSSRAPCPSTTSMGPEKGSTREEGPAERTVVPGVGNRAGRHRGVHDGAALCVERRLGEGVAGVPGSDHPP